MPLLYNGETEGFFKDDVLPYAPDIWVWYGPNIVKVCYEISFTCHFYKPQPMRPLSEVMADIGALEREDERLLAEIIGK